ncbi:hypothetical protein BYT27DRAFT_7214724 [Phlegmacium glaucopus]|nr:hypothetical protein BYT27DRAFT_7214724 [Phlegmacium glaucopus]
MRRWPVPHWPLILWCYYQHEGSQMAVDDKGALGLKKRPRLIAKFQPSPSHSTGTPRRIKKFSSTCIYYQQLPGISPAMWDGSAQGWGVKGGIRKHEGRPTVSDTHQATLGPKLTSYTLPHTPQSHHLANQAVHTTTDTQQQEFCLVCTPYHRLTASNPTGLQRPNVNKYEVKQPNSGSKHLAQGQRQGKRPNGSSMDPMQG